tara:strand:+ start:79 stop:486 length:408 start_codon:yes stop_codon:yes gene_type:complete
MENVEMIIEGRDIDRVQNILTKKYKSEKDGFANESYEVYKVKGITFRVPSKDAFTKDIIAKGEKVRAIYLIQRKGVELGVDSDGLAIIKDLWDFDGYSTVGSYLSNKKVEGLAKRYSEGNFTDTANIVELEEAVG